MIVSIHGVRKRLANGLDLDKKSEVKSQESEVKMKTTSTDAPAAKTFGAVFRHLEVAPQY
jgi:hypothetical protein